MDRLNGDFPPAFVSVGNGDDLRPQSIALADALEKHGVRVDRLIFPDDTRRRCITSTSSTSIGRKRARRSTDRPSS